MRLCAKYGKDEVVGVVVDTLTIITGSDRGPWELGRATLEVSQSISQSVSPELFQRQLQVDIWRAVVVMVVAVPE